MADENIKDFTMTWILIGLLFFCLLAFAISFMYYNNPTSGFGDSEHFFGDTSTSLQGNLFMLTNNSDNLLNITSETNPEISQLGSRDSVATAYGIYGNSKSIFTSTKIFLGWIFSGTVGQLLIAVFSGLFIFTGIYYITKYIRNGI